ncbi:MAG: SAM-dependent methyltransferase [Gammaproteobacteria bacterium]|jgi:SAM-dependent MidA family methyltransferase|nr:SAM-dependent methyltransferase [Gammaproteobacteria bacterium]
MSSNTPSPADVHRQKRRIDQQIRDLPPPDEAAQQQSQRLIQLIRERIVAAGGQISFADYMSLALYAPGLGYYSAGNQKFGKGGDFVTAPEISPLFSQCVARQCQQVFSQLDARHGQAPVILEVGGGSGIMAADILAEMERLDCLPGAYRILELSAELQHRQSETIAAKVPHLLERVQWLQALPTQPFNGVVLANELLDAMPVHRICWPDSSKEPPREAYVAWQQDRFVWQFDTPGNERLRQRAAEIAELLEDHVEGHSRAEYLSEINLAAQAWVKTLAEVLNAGMLLIIDYGFPRHEYYHPQRSTGTLMCHYRHRNHHDPFVYPGLQDITAHVDFTAIAEAGAASGLHVAGYNTQGFFLLASGLHDLMGKVDPEDTVEYLRLSQNVKMLTLPSEMGELFKVMALTRGIETPLLGFSQQDLRNRL